MTAWALTEDELAVLRLACVLFPTPESPLRAIADGDHEPADAASTYEALRARGLVDGSPDARLAIVSECDARIRHVRQGSSGQKEQDYYVADKLAVAYLREDDRHVFAPPVIEEELAKRLAQGFSPRTAVERAPLRLSSGDYLVFAVFARDLRTAPADGMSLDEVLAYFDEPETKYVRTPNDESWQESVRSLRERGVLVAQGDALELHPSLHDVAQKLLADQQETIVRFDFFDEHWLVREINLYPTPSGVYRIATEPDGTVVLEELSKPQLMQTISGIVTTLPDILAARPVSG